MLSHDGISTTLRDNTVSDGSQRSTPCCTRRDEKHFESFVDNSNHIRKESVLMLSHSIAEVSCAFSAHGSWLI
jgi:hypothetical protein